MATDPIYPGSVRGFAARINNTTDPTTVVTGAANGTRIEHLRIYNDHTSAMTAMVFLVAGGTTAQLLRKDIALRATWNVLAELDVNFDKQFVVLAPGDSIQVVVAAAVASNVDISGDGGDY